MNPSILLLMTACMPSADPGWVAAPAAPSYSSWGNGGGWQSAPPSDGRHGLFHGRKGFFHRKNQGGNPPSPGPSPVPQYGAAAPGTMNTPGVPGAVTSATPQAGCNCARPAPSSAPEYGVAVQEPMTTPVLPETVPSATASVPTAPPAIAPEPTPAPATAQAPAAAAVTYPVFAATTPIPNGPSGPPPAMNFAKPLPRGDPTLKEPF